MRFIAALTLKNCVRNKIKQNIAERKGEWRVRIINSIELCTRVQKTIEYVLRKESRREQDSMHLRSCL